MLILHGENIVSSRRKLNEIIKNFSGEIVRFDGKSIDISKLKQSTESKSLFGSDRLVIIENIFSLPQSKAKENILEYLKNNQTASLVLWEKRKIDGRTLAGFKTAKIEKFDLSNFIFRFVDSLAPGNQKFCLSLLHQCLNNDPPEIVFYMLTRQMRLLIIVKDLGTKGLEKMADWQKNKLFGQSKKFSQEQLLAIYRNLLKIDYEQKTGNNTLNLSSSLDLLLTSI